MISHSILSSLLMPTTARYVEEFFYLPLHFTRIMLTI